MESMILATKSGTPIIGQIAVVMGWIMNAIYKVLDAVGIQNIGLCIIIFSILIYLCMTPLQIKQQKFSKLSAIMQPEIQKIQKKYANKRDQVSMQKQQDEMNMVYEKYGVKMSSICDRKLRSAGNPDADPVCPVSGNPEHSGLCWKCLQCI